MKMKRTKKAVLIATALFVGTVGQTEAGSPGQTTLLLDLQGCIDTALKAAPELGEAEADLELTASKLAEAKAHRYPQLDAMALFGPAPGAKRSDINPLVNTDKKFSIKDLTWFANANLMVTQPLYTFGKISESMKAATHGIEVDRSRKQQKGNEVALEVKKYYYGLLFAREMLGVLDELDQYMQQGKRQVQALIDKGADSGDPMDLYKIDAYSGAIHKFRQEAIKGERLATAALKARLGLGDNVNISVHEERLEPPVDSIPDTGSSIEKARQQRPEFKQLAEGIAARTALVEAAKGYYYPDIFLAGMASWSYSDGRERVKNPYLNDPFNHSYAAIALGVRWHLDFGITSAKVAAERAQLNRLTSTKNYAESYIPLQTEKALLEMQEAKNNIENSRTAFMSARKWAAAALANFDFGVGDPRDIFDAVEVYGKMKGAYYQAIYDFRIAQANLDYATGERQYIAAR